MPVSPAREASYRILLHVESGHGYAVDMLQARRVSTLKEADRRLATEITMGALRRRGDLDYWLEKLSGKKVPSLDPEIATILRSGLYQIQYLQKIPKSAVVNESVELTKAARKRSATGFVNAVLRKAAPIQEMLGLEVRHGKSRTLNEARTASEVRALPVWLAEKWKTQYGNPRMETLAALSLRVPKTTLRVEGGEAGRVAAQGALSAEGIATLPGKYASGALVVETGLAQNSSVVRGKRAVIQDEGSQLVVSLVAPQAGHRVLDLCAAPGMKTGAMAQIMRQGLLVACDFSARRLQTMKELLAGAIPGSVNLLLVRLDATRELCFDAQFNRILLDAPCSGTGTLARNPEIKWRLQPQDLPRLAEIQAKMLRNALGVLALNERLVYATCSLETEENEQIVEKVMREVAGFEVVSGRELSGEFPALASFFDPQGYFRSRPDLHGMDGFFAAVIRRIPA